jgi:hypothetical protein
MAFPEGPTAPQEPKGALGPGESLAGALPRYMGPFRLRGRRGVVLSSESVAAQPARRDLSDAARI